MSGVLPEATHTRNILQVVSSCDTHSQGDPELPAHQLAAGSQRGIQSCLVLPVMAQCAMGKSGEYCVQLKDSEALKKVMDYAIDATPRSDYLRLGVQQLNELLHKKTGST